MVTRARLVLWLALTGAVGACDLNPQPALPGSESSGPGTAGRNPGGMSAGGSLNLGAGGIPTSGGGSDSDVPVIGNGGNSAGEVPSGGEGGAGVEGGAGGAEAAGAAGEAGAPNTITH